MKKWLFILLLNIFSLSLAQASEVACVSTTWRLINNDKVCVLAFNDPDIDGVVCHLSYAQTGGISGALGFAENPSLFSISCSQVGPLKASKAIPLRQEKIFTQRMSFLFKDINIHRLVDTINNTLVYLVISERIIEGSPFNSISTVPLMPWNGESPLVPFKKK